MHPSRIHAPAGAARRLLPVLAALAVLAAGGPVGAAAAAPEVPAGRFRQVDTLPLATGGRPLVSVSTANASGWLILDTRMRRGYQLFETASTTIIQSFDLDTLAPRRRAELQGFPLDAGPSTVPSGEGTYGAGEVLHAVDAEAGRIYLPLSETLSVAGTSGQTGSTSPDARRGVARFVMIDEAAFDRCGGQAGCPWAASFKEPAGQARLHTYSLMGMTMTRRHPGSPSPGGPVGMGKLVLAWADPTPASGMPAYNHWLVQWDPARLAATAGDENQLEATTTKTADDDWLAEGGPVLLSACARARMTGFGAKSQGSYQWGILVTASAVWTVCQAEAQSATVVRVGLKPDDGRPKPGEAQRSFPLSLPVSDVLVDEGAERLILRSFLGGNTLWVFDTRTQRYRGSLALKQGTNNAGIALGLDGTTGRLYALVPDHSSAGVPIRGGLQYAETRLDPVPPLENVEPDLDYQAQDRIQIDPATRRFFLRRGHAAFRFKSEYPGVQETTAAPVENFYRVFRDEQPVAQQPPETDTSGFTTDVAEGPLTRASYLGSGSGYGSRTLLIKGLDGPAQGNATRVSPTCGKEDRELLAGSVGQVSVSDLTASAEAAALDGDGRTQSALAAPVQKCLADDQKRTTPVDTQEAAFDGNAPTPVCSTDPTAPARVRCSPSDGSNRYAVGCIGDESPEAAAVTGKAVPRAGFKATVVCDQKGDYAEGRAEGSVPVAESLPAPPPGGVPGLRVGYSSSVVTTKRAAGSGITTRVESIARDVEIAGVATIGVVRTVATSTATGRRGGATADFTRWICGVELPDDPGSSRTGCLSEDDQRSFVEHLNGALQGKGEARVRNPDPALKDGSRDGYRSAVVRDRLDLFGDRVVTKDDSLAVPGLEIILYLGDGSASGGGAARQILQLAGVQAGTSYGIACLYGEAPGGGRCAKEGEGFGSDDDELTTASPGDPEVITVVEEVAVDGDGSDALSANGSRSKESLITRIVKAPFRALEQAMRLLFNNPRELGLMAAVWALLYAPCWLGERRRSIRDLRARRVAVGGLA